MPLPGHELMAFSGFIKPRERPTKTREQGRTTPRQNPGERANTGTDERAEKTRRTEEERNTQNTTGERTGEKRRGMTGKKNREKRNERQGEEEGETEPREPKRKQTKTEAEGKSSIGKPARHRHPLRLQQRMKQVSLSSSLACKFNYSGTVASMRE